MLDAKYQGFSVVVLFLPYFPIEEYVKHVSSRWGYFLPQGHNLNKLGSGSLGDATYHISRL